MISVVTINLNNKVGLEKTIESVISQDYRNKIEYIIIDGNSIDGSKDIINKYRDRIDKVLIEKDNGIFDAMNKGIELAKGGYIYFLNSGDVFVSNYVVRTVISFIQQKDSEIYCGNVDALLDGKFIKKTDVYPWLPHQGAFVSRKLLLQYKFDTDFKIFGDLDLWVRLKKDNNLVVKYLDFSIASMEMDGIGSNPVFWRKRLRDKRIFNKKHHVGSYVMIFLYLDNILGYLVYRIFGSYIYWKYYIYFRMKLKRKMYAESNNTLSKLY